MKHLADEQIRTLADKLLSGADFSRDDERAMLHIANCEVCYTLLRCTMAVMNVTNHISEAIQIPPKEQNEASGAAQSGVVIKLVVLNVVAMLEQLREETTKWVFEPPFELAGARSAGENAPNVQTITDIDNSATFVAYDPETRRLIIQIDDQDITHELRAFLKYADGNMQNIRFEKRGNVFCAEVCGLDDGEYELIIEK